jgi:anti-anti-sigma factor
MLDDAATRLSDHCSMRDEQHLGSTIIRLIGDFDLASYDRFQEELERLLDNETKSLALDLVGLEYIDSTGLRMLMQIDALARRSRFDFTVLCGKGRVRAVLRTSGLDGVLPLVDPSGMVPASDSPV